MKKHPNLSSSWRNPIMSMMIMMSLILCLGHQDFLVLLFCLLFHCVSEETLCDSCWTSCLTRSLFHCKEESRVRSPDKNRDQIACYHHLSASFYCDERVISFSVHLYLISWIENDLRWMLFMMILFMFKKRSIALKSETEKGFETVSSASWVSPSSSYLLFLLHFICLISSREVQP